uniref:Uncharacterized protein n=1 Tax=Anopheles christyi TaxID=43041 RepID=A0A182KI42_9DIPT
MIALISRWAMVHQNDSSDTWCSDLRNASGNRKIPHSIIQDRVSRAPSGKEPAIRSPHTTTYRMQVISSSMICAMLTTRAPIFLPKHTFAIDT